MGWCVVVKVFKSEFFFDLEFIEWFWVEVCIIVMLNYLGIVSVYDYGES